ncbi:hypothetical protein [Arthrobacter alkaliphilus]|uniref:hypothetical protein n=1 Tax=Arthrobacter alkaliphilus TaxID=369936 RepID=UPI001F2F73FD|nr:hypothetical protein [Arthrobacter alkaliphilus]
MSTTIVGPIGEPAVMIESLPVSAGQHVTVTFEAVGPRWRQGVFIATAGRLEIAGTSSPSLVLWSDSAPASSTITVVETDGRLVFYNVWDSGRGRKFESQSFTSGMLVEPLADGSSKYSCADIGTEPDFSRIVFRVRIE